MKVRGGRAAELLRRKYFSHLPGILTFVEMAFDVFETLPDFPAFSFQVPGAAGSRSSKVPASPVRTVCLDLEPTL